MSEWEELPYTEWLEETVKTIFEQNPDKISVCARLKDDCTLTAYYQCDAEDKAVFAHHITADAMLDIVLNNIGTVKEALNDFEPEEPTEG